MACVDARGAARCARTHVRGGAALEVDEELGSLRNTMIKTRKGAIEFEK